LRQAHQELEQHLEGHGVLAEVLKRLDAERSSHLGRALAKPVADRFLALVGGTYTSVRLGPSFRAEGVEAAGDVRGLDLLSVGTRDQLATLIRLAIAEHLRTALLLDDQLTQSDPDPPAGSATPSSPPQGAAPRSSSSLAAPRLSRPLGRPHP
jgi:hypothetical protein